MASLYETDFLISNDSSESLNETQTRSKSHRIRHLFYPFWILLIFFFLFILSKTSHPTPTLLLVSLDGFRPEYLQRNKTPTLNSFVQYGTFAPFMLPVFPSITFPNHYSIITGRYPESHGIVGNTFFDRKRNATFTYTNASCNRESFWWEEAEPLWVTLEKQGFITASLMWPGSEAWIHQTKPTFTISYQKDFSILKRMDQVLSWLDLSFDQRPRLILVYIPDVDVAGHQTGVDSKELNSTLEQIDNGFHYLQSQLKLRKLWDSLNLMIVSDHGMMNIQKENIIYLNEYIDVKLFQIIENGPLLHVYVHDPYWLDRAYQNLTQRAHFQVWKRTSISKQLHFQNNDRIGDLVLLADPTWIFQLDSLNRVNYPIGMHGYNSSHPDMHSIFMGHGPDFPNKKLEPFENVELYAWMCRLLNVHPLPHNGSWEL